ncbi:MAG: UPF0149 family protein [Acidithiobacillus ferriphilus]|jgi:hypothetical protein|nr:UPF0149 family protein [Acidithiobacillus ferriphilus]
MVSNKMKPKKTPVDRDQIQSLLQKHGCPMPYHQVRAILMGNIAAPDQVSPTDVLRRIWGGTLPEFADLEALKELMDTLFMGLWNRLADHQSARDPFRLSRRAWQPTAADLLVLVRTRMEELEGFWEGFFGDQESVMSSKPAHEALEAIGEARSLLAASIPLLEREDASNQDQQLRDLLRNFTNLTDIAEKSIQKVITESVRMRRMQTGATMEGFSQTRH